MPSARSELLRLASQLAQLRKWKQSHIFIPLTSESARGNLIHTVIYSSPAAQGAILAAEEHQSLRSFSTSPKRTCMQGLESEQNYALLLLFHLECLKATGTELMIVPLVVSSLSFIIAREQPLRNKQMLYFNY